MDTIKAKHPKRLNLLVRVLIVMGMLLGLALGVYATTLVVSEFVHWWDGGGMQRWQLAASYAAMVLSLAGAEYIGLTLYRMMQTLESDPFVEWNVAAFRRMGITALCITALCLLTLVFWPVPLAVLASLPIGMCGLFSIVLSRVFARAVAYKQENDLTV